jgi:hypothetical protein
VRAPEGFTLYGPVYDSRALTNTIAVLQAQGQTVHCSKSGNHWLLYVKDER